VKVICQEARMIVRGVMIVGFQVIMHLQTRVGEIDSESLSEEAVILFLLKRTGPLLKGVRCMEYHHQIGQVAVP